MYLAIFFFTVLTTLHNTFNDHKVARIPELTDRGLMNLYPLEQNILVIPLCHQERKWFSTQPLHVGRQTDTDIDTHTHFLQWLWKICKVMYWTHPYHDKRLAMWYIHIVYSTLYNMHTPTKNFSNSAKTMHHEIWNCIVKLQLVSLYIPTI